METPGRVGKYEIEQFLGGGMAHVYRAKDTVLGRRVALKMLTDKAMADPRAKERFLEEARTASNLSHENIISVFDFGEDQGRPFMVMEFLEGESLRHAIEAGTLGSLDRRLKIAIQVGRAIDYIHARKIVHRDIKPENVHVDLTGRAKLMDFGIAKNDVAENLSATIPGMTLGTPYYMAPEQVLGRPLTAHADIYSYGVLLFEVLAGQKAVNADTVDKIFQQVLYEPLKVDPLVAAGVPDQVIEMLKRCTTKQILQRPSNLGVVCDEIQRVLDAPKDPPTVRIQVPVAVPAPAPVRPPAAKPASASGEAVMPWMIQKLPRDLRSPASLTILACGFVVFFAMLLYAFLLRLRVL